MRALWPLLALLALALALAGCSSPESRLVGKWKGQIDLPRELESSPFGAIAQSVANPELDLKPDKTFTLYMGPVPVEGTWSYAEDTNEVVLNATKYMGLSPAEVKKKAAEGAGHMLGKGTPAIPGMPNAMPDPGQPMRIGIGKDWKTLSLDPGMGSVRFTKV